MIMMIFPIYFSLDHLIAELHIMKFIAESNACKKKKTEDSAPNTRPVGNFSKISDLNVIYVDGGK